MKKEFHLFNNKNQKNIRKSLRKNTPKGEKLLWYSIRNKKLSYKFRRQYSVGKYVIDFYCPKLKLAIEIDGWTHDFIDSTDYDKQRQRYLESLGIKVKRFLSQDIFDDLDSVTREIWILCRELDNDR